MPEHHNTPNDDEFLTSEQIIAIAQLAVLRAQINPDDPTIAKDLFRIAHSLLAHTKLVQERMDWLENKQREISALLLAQLQCPRCGHHFLRGN